MIILSSRLKQNLMSMIQRYDQHNRLCISVGEETETFKKFTEKIKPLKEKLDDLVKE